MVKGLAPGAGFRVHTPCFQVSGVSTPNPTLPTWRVWGVQFGVEGLGFNAHRLCVSLNSRHESNKEEEEKVSGRGVPVSPHPTPIIAQFFSTSHLQGL